MFEIEDDDDGFWEKLPLDEVGFESQTKHLSSSTTVKGIDFPSGSNHLTSGSSNEKLSSICPLRLASSPVPSVSVNNSNDNGQANRPQLVPIHNVISNNRAFDGTSVAATSSGIPKNNHPSQITLSVEDPLRVDYLIADQTSSRFSNKSSYKPGSKRKFPGPAGILPESFPSDPSKLQPDSPVIVKDPTINEVFPSSQSSSSCDPFSSAPWQSLISDIGLDAKSVLCKFAIKAMLIKASKRVLPKGKIPLVLAFIDAVDFHGCDGTAVLRDPSGKVHGALHNDLVKDPSTALKTGWVIVLRQTSVISPTPRTHYLNITPANIVVIYSQTKNSSAVCKSPWSPTVSFNPTSPSSTLPSLSQIIQDSDNELTAALNYHNRPPTPQQATSRQAPGTPNLSQMSLFGSISNNSPLFQPRNRFPATPNTPVYNRFRSPIPNSQTGMTRMHPPASNQHTTNPLRNSTNPFQPKSLTTQNRLSSTHTLANCKINNFQRTTGIHHQNPHLSSNDNRIASTVPISVSNNTSVQASSALHDDFFDDDSDLLSLCDDSDIMDNKNMTSNTNNSKSITSNHKSNTENASKHLLHDGQNKYIHSGSHQNFTINLKDTVFDSEQICKSGSDLKEDANDVKGGIFNGGGNDRDERIQLGVSKSKPPPQNAVNAEQASNFGTWDDDLDDELLSQL